MKRKTVRTGSLAALVEMTEADQTHFQAWLQNPELRTLIHDDRVPTMTDQMNWFKRVQEPDRKFYSIITLDGELIGNGGFVDIDPQKNEATMRITIGNPAFVGKGFGSDAIKLFVQEGFEAMKLKRITLKVLKENERAIKSYQKSGFRMHGEATQAGKQMFLMVLDSPHA